MSETNDNREYVERWKRVGPQLRKIEHEELRAFRFDEQWELVDGLLQFAFDQPDLPERTTTGLVDQQQWFARARE